MRAAVTWAVFVQGLLACLQAQTPTEVETKFEVASFRRSVDQNRQRGETGAPPRLSGRTTALLTFHRVTLTGVIATAYALRPGSVDAPSWMADTLYDISAKIPPGSSEDQVRTMLQSLLAERVHMRTHWDSQPRRGYLLSIGKTPLRISPTHFKDGEVPRPRESYSTSSGHVQLGFRDVTMDDISKSLETLLARPVQNVTNLSGEFTITLDCDPESLPGFGRMTPSDGSTVAPSVFTAIRSLGLELVPGNVVNKRLIVDGADANPTEN